MVNEYMALSPRKLLDDSIDEECYYQEACSMKKQLMNESSDEETTSSSLMPLPDTLDEMRNELKSTINSLCSKPMAFDDSPKIEEFSTPDLDLGMKHPIEMEESLTRKITDANIMLDDMLNTSNILAPQVKDKNPLVYTSRVAGRRHEDAPETEVGRTETSDESTTSGSSRDQCRSITISPFVVPASFHSRCNCERKEESHQCGMPAHSVSMQTCSSDMKQTSDTKLHDEGMQFPPRPQQSSPEEGPKKPKKSNNLTEKMRLICSRARNSNFKKSCDAISREALQQKSGGHHCEDGQVNSLGIPRYTCQCDHRNHHHKSQAVNAHSPNCPNSFGHTSICSHTQEQRPQFGRCMCKESPTQQKRECTCPPVAKHSSKDCVCPLAAVKPRKECTCRPSTKPPDKECTCLPIAKQPSKECTCPPISEQPLRECACLPTTKSTNKECTCSPIAVAPPKECTCSPVAKTAPKECTDQPPKECTCPPSIKPSPRACTCSPAARKSAEEFPIPANNASPQCNGCTCSPSPEPNFNECHCSDECLDQVVAELLKIRSGTCNCLETKTGVESDRDSGVEPSRQPSTAFNAQQPPKTVKFDNNSVSEAGGKTAKKSKKQERIDIYYFDHGNSAYYRTTDSHPAKYTEYLIERTDEYATKFWAEIFGTITIATSFVISFILQLYRCLFTAVIRGLIVGLIQIFSDYFFKPFLTILFNGLIQPCLILGYNVATSLRDFCVPVSEICEFFAKDIAILCRSCRFIEINRPSCSPPAPGCRCNLNV